MNRRESLKLLALALAASAGALPAGAVARSHSPILIYDGRFAVGRDFARKGVRAYDCQIDAASLWFGRFAGRAGRIPNIVGLTSAADAMVLADCARREGLAFARAQPTGQAGELVAWTIYQKNSDDSPLGRRAGIAREQPQGGILPSNCQNTQ